jgi:hypothetical protein
MQPVSRQVQRGRAFASVQQNQHPTQLRGELRINPAGIVTRKQPLKAFVPKPLNQRLM